MLPFWKSNISPTIIQRVCQLRGWAKDTPKNKEIHTVMLEIWEGLRSKADKDNDGQVGTLVANTKNNQEN